MQHFSWRLLRILCMHTSAVSKYSSIRVQPMVKNVLSARNTQHRRRIIGLDRITTACSRHKRYIRYMRNTEHKRTCRRFSWSATLRQYHLQHFSKLITGYFCRRCSVVELTLRPLLLTDRPTDRPCSQSQICWTDQWIRALYQGYLV
jgi:hypothetical protein